LAPIKAGGKSYLAIRQFLRACSVGSGEITLVNSENRPALLNSIQKLAAIRGACSPLEFLNGLVSYHALMAEHQPVTQE
jgi:hypothetical protein